MSGEVAVYSPSKRGNTSVGTITLRVPLAFRKRGGRKLVLAPEGSSWTAPRPQVNNTLLKALARGFRWRKLLETGAYATLEELARAERINASYMGRLLRLTLLPPAEVEAILDGRQPAEWTLAGLLQPKRTVWPEVNKRTSG